MEKNIVACWRPEFKSLYKGVDAQKCASEIESIGDDVTPQEIVDKARNDRTELHKAFEWRDDVAAEKYRVYQARQLCINLIIRREEVTADTPPTRFFYKASGNRGYQKSEYIYRNDDEHAALLARANNELLAWKRRYAGIEELSEIFDTIEKLVG